MELEKRGIKLVAPTFAFSLGKEFMHNSFAHLGDLLGKNKAEIGFALQKGMEAHRRFEERIAANGQVTMEKLDPQKKTFVIISKMYGVADPVLNLGIPEQLLSMGYQVIPFFDLPEGANIAKEHPNMFWPFGQHILEPAYLIREHPNLYAILLTHHGCGPDSVLLHFFKEIMGRKPYLNIEIDEHASKIGITTRIEAFVNSLKQNVNCTPKALDSYIKGLTYSDINIQQKLIAPSNEVSLYIPNLQPYSAIIQEQLIQRGFSTAILETNAKTIELGRQQTLTNEYYSLTSLLGSCFHAAVQNKGKKNISLLIPQTEGAEIGGQYSRILRTKLNEHEHNNIRITAPFLEDLLLLRDSNLESIFHCVLAGDIINAAPQENRSKYLLQVKELIQGKNLNLSSLKVVARSVYEDQKTRHYKKRILAIGEPMIVFNDYLNNFTFRTLEEQKHKVVYATLSEAVWLFWKDHVMQNKTSSDALNQKLAHLADDIKQISTQLQDESPFTPRIESLLEKADTTIGFYAGAFARYRQAKVLCSAANVDGIITAASLYENTGVSLSILHKGFSTAETKPLLNLTFDGNQSERDTNKIESFVYYL